MEKRLFLAFFLSFVVVLIWGKINPPPKPTTTAKTTQTIDNNVVNELDSSTVTPIPAASTDLSVDFEEEADILRNDKIEVHFSNRGGVISKLVLRAFGDSLPITGIYSIKSLENAPFKRLAKTDRSIVYFYEKNGMKATLAYELGEDYTISTKCDIQSSRNDLEDIQIRAFTLDISRLDKNISKSRDKGLLEYSVSTEEGVYRKANAFKIAQKDDKFVEKTVKWLGFRDKYYCFVVKPDFSSEAYSIKSLSDNRLGVNVQSRAEDDQSGHLSLNSTIYFGPQDKDVLKSYNKGFESVMRFSKIGIFDFTANIVYKLLNFIHKMVPNWGICIILTAILVYFAMYPLSMKGMMSMKRMQALQPEIAKIKEQYKNNPQRLQKETMELYKEHKINPLGGCFPLLLQMPFFIGVYQVLWRTVAFRGAKFLWIKDLSQPDHLLHFPVSLPFLGEYLNILPIFMVILMVFQQKLSAKNMVITDPAQASSQKMMMFFFPLMIGAIFYKIASGLSLYFSTFYILSTITQWRMSKKTKVL